eukprot:6660972-Prymnesium_polylepis.1
MAGGRPQYGRRPIGYSCSGREGDQRARGLGRTALPSSSKGGGGSGTCRRRECVCAIWGRVQATFGRRGGAGRWDSAAAHTRVARQGHPAPARARRSRRAPLARSCHTAIGAAVVGFQGGVNHPGMWIQRV